MWEDRKHCLLVPSDQQNGDEQILQARSNLLYNVLLGEVPRVEIGDRAHNDGKALPPVAQHVADEGLTVRVVTGNELEGLVQEKDGQGEFEHNQPLVDGQGGDVENDIQNVDVEDDKVKSEGQSHGTQQPHVHPWGHEEERLIL